MNIEDIYNEDLKRKNFGETLFIIIVLYNFLK